MGAAVMGQWPTIGAEFFFTNFVILSSEIKTGFFFIKATLYACKEGGNSGQGLSQAIIIIIIIII